MRTRRNILVILSIGIILIVSIFFTFNKREEYKELPKVIIKEQNNKNQFALMLEQTKGNGDYQESSSDDLPLGGYKFNDKRSNCIDVNGKIVENVLSYDYDNYKVLLDTSKTLYCYLYYDRDNVINYLRSTDTEKHLSSELVGDMYRYQGLATEDVRNYICLGDYCCNTTECKADSNDDMYRIIGITKDGEVKIIKKVQLPWFTLGSFNTEDIKWPYTSVYQKLNGKSEESTLPNLNDTNSYYYSLNNNLKKLIVNHSWLYGDISNSVTYNGNFYYDIESGNSNANHYIKNEYSYTEEAYKWTETVEAPLGLMYIHDYLFSYPNGNPENSTNAKNSWMYCSNNQIDVGSEYTITRYGYDFSNKGYYALLLGANGDVYRNMTTNFSPRFRPVFYLTSDIELTGDGTKENPFLISNL